MANDCARQGSKFVRGRRKAQDVTLRCYPDPVFYRPGSKSGQVTIYGIEWRKTDDEHVELLIETEEGWRRIDRQYLGAMFDCSITPLGMFDEQTELTLPASEYRPDSPADRMVMYEPKDGI